MKTKRRTKPPKGDWNYHQLWKLVDGAVADAFVTHPEYLSGDHREWVVRQSINKRVVGTILGYAEQAWGRSGNAPSCAGMAADNASGPMAWLFAWCGSAKAASVAGCKRSRGPGRCCEASRPFTP